MSEKERTRTFTWEDPTEATKAAGEMSGFEYLRAIARGELPAAPMADLMGFGFHEIEEGRVVFDCIPAEYHYNPIGAVHGGLACTLVDSAMGCAVHTMLPAGVGYTTLELKTNLLRRITVETGRLLCEGKTIHVGRSVAVAEARLMGEVSKSMSTRRPRAWSFRARESILLARKKDERRALKVTIPSEDQWNAGGAMRGQVSFG